MVRRKVDALNRACREWAEAHGMPDWNDREWLQRLRETFGKWCPEWLEKRLAKLSEEEQPPRWIPRIERMPERLTMILGLTTDGKGRPYPVLCFWDAYTGWRTPLGVEIELCRITHWLPLPPVPQEL